MATTYQYSIAGDFGGNFNRKRFEIEISDSAIEIALVGQGQGVGVVGDVVTVTFKADLDATNEEVLQGNNPDPPPYGGLVAAHTGEPVDLTPPTIVRIDSTSAQADGAVRVAPAAREGSEFIIATHDFADPTTWFHESMQVVDQAAVRSTFMGREVWRLPHREIIDLVHGKYLKEDRIADQYTVTVKVDGVEQQMIDELYPIPQFAAGDYLLNHKTGEIYPRTSWNGSTVTASYHHAMGSGWVLEPDPGSMLLIEDAESQFAGAKQRDTIIFRLKGYAAAFAPHLVGVVINPETGELFQDTDRVTLGEETYKTYKQILMDARGAYPLIQTISGERGMETDVSGFPFRYGTYRKLSSAAGMQLEMRLAHDFPCEGEMITATFYGTAKDES